jgi:adenosine kinase
VGKDDFATQLRVATRNEGVRTEYLTVDTPTGKCGVVITGHDRSLVTDLGAANKYSETHLSSPEIWGLVENAKYYYVGGYHLTVCPAAIIALGEHAARNDKVFFPEYCTAFNSRSSQ